MSDYEKQLLENNFKKFTRKHFERPSRCKNIGQIQYYVQELSLKIEEFKSRFNYVPNIAYVLLSEYNASQNKLIFKGFQKIYAWYWLSDNALYPLSYFNIIRSHVPGGSKS